MVLPKAPNTAPRRSYPPAAAPTPPPSMNTAMTTFPDYDSLRNNYLNMLSSNGQSNALIDGVNNALETSPIFSDLGDDFMTPMDTPLFDFSDASPFPSPLDDYLTTPLFQDVDDTAITGDFDGMELFGGVLDEPPLPEKPQPQPEQSQTKLNMDELYTFSPTSPALDSVNPSPYMGVDMGYRPPVTGMRKGTNPQTMIPLDAPTQPRHYRTPSVTSRKQAPAAYSRKRAREDDDVGELPPGATEEEQIAFKRRQNTIAARKSRKRKLEYTQALELKVDELTVQIEQYKAKTEIYAGVLQSHGLVLPSLPP
ncbi:hypothetical protein CPB85DRAFT_1289053 [Mucidula mucida]|nr:hypothetical protein CPB85DRAFT_1289053 [Mucidula mucida]